MRICFIGPANSAHIEKWSHFFLSKGHEVHIVSFSYGDIPGTQIHVISCGVDGGSGDAKKIRYLLKAGEVGRLVRSINPDIVNAHYATSYGTVAALAGLKNYILSIWGSDIYEFPGKSPLHRALLSFSLNRAPHLFSTSLAMAEEAAKYTNKKFEITPFGVDTALFSPDKRNRQDESFVIGTVKGLSHVYGLEYLLRAAALVRKDYPEIPLKLRIAGTGPDEDALKTLSGTLGIDDIITWLGFIPQEQAAKEWANFDLAIICSLQESFGVAALEAQACGCPLIISDAPGLLETTRPGVTSVVVPKKDERAIANEIIAFYFDTGKRLSFGKAGRLFVERNYEYSYCFSKIEKLFNYIA